MSSESAIAFMCGSNTILHKPKQATDSKREVLGTGTYFDAFGIGFLISSANRPSPKVLS